MNLTLLLYNRDGRLCQTVHVGTADHRRLSELVEVRGLRLLGRLKRFHGDIGSFGPQEVERVLEELAELHKACADDGLQRVVASLESLAVTARERHSSITILAELGGAGAGAP